LQQGFRTIVRKGARLVCAGLLAWAALAPGPAGAEMPRAMERWQVHDPLSHRTVDHTAWGRLLGQYVREVRPGVTRFDYAAVGSPDQAALESYLAELSDTDVDRLDRDEQLAFWLNAYNALLVKAVLDAWPVKSPNDAGGGFFSPGPWEEKSFAVYGIALSPRDIAERIVRAWWPGGLSIYGLACAAKGCPNLPRAPFRGANVMNMLRANAADFVNRGPGILGIQGNAVRLSSFYQWYGDDLGGEAGILSAIKGVAGGEIARALAPVTEISGHGFDWGLNAPEDAR
jgi:Protein of unknown function, DUF547